VQSGQHSGQHLSTDENVCSARKDFGSFVEESVSADLSGFSQSPPSTVKQTHVVTQPVLSCSANEPALSTTSATNHLSAQYSQFLAGVRDFKPLVADLNASIASIASSVTTMQAGVSSNVQNGNVAGSQQYVGDVRIHSPVSQPELTVTDDGHHQRQITHSGSSISHSHGTNIQICIFLCGYYATVFTS